MRVRGVEIFSSLLNLNILLSCIFSLPHLFNQSDVVVWPRAAWCLRWLQSLLNYELIFSNYAEKWINGPWLHWDGETVHFASYLLGHWAWTKIIVPLERSKKFYCWLNLEPFRELPLLAKSLNSSRWCPGMWEGICNLSFNRSDLMSKVGEPTQHKNLE